MRRHEKEITDIETLEWILRKGQVCHLAMNESEEPYIVPVNYGYEENALYIHSALTGNKIELLEEDPHVAFSIVAQSEVITAPKACSYSTSFASVMGKGKATFLLTSAEKKQGLSVIMKHFNGPTDDFPDNILEKVCVIRIDIFSMTGKASKEAIPE